MSMRRKLWKQNRKLQRGLTCDQILFPGQPAPAPRRLSSGSLTSGSEENENEPDPPVVRRGRRAAIFETKNCGDVSPTTLSPEVSPSNSCDEGEGATNIAGRLRRRRSSVDLAMNIYPGDLLVQEHHKKLIKRNTIADFYAGRNGTTGGPVNPEDPNKKGRQPFSLLKLMKARSKESLSQLEEVLAKMKPSQFKDNHLAVYKNLHWSDLIASTDKQNQHIPISDTERKRREAVWEIFKSECVFLIDHLMVLKHSFLEPLKKVQVEGYLMYAEPQDIFGNLDELCYVSYTFCKDFLSALLKDMSSTEFGRTRVLIKAFQRFSTHTKDGAVYHTYCLNYTNALSYLDKLSVYPEFAEFAKWCELDPRCNRLQLTDLLVAPMQHCTKLPLLLNNIRKYTADEVERQLVTESIQKMETSLKNLEEKMKWVKNFERVQEIQRQITWPPVSELDPRSYIPECLKATLCRQPCEKLLSCPKRQLVYEGQLILIEPTKAVDVHMFLFHDILLLTKPKKGTRKKQTTTDSGAKSPCTGSGIDKASYTVYRQPIALDRFTLHDITSSDATASGLKNAFVLAQFSRFQQIIGVYTLQASCDTTKATWVTNINEAKEKFCATSTSRQSSFKENRNPKTEEKEVSVSRSPRRVKRNSVMRRIHGKSRSMDAVFL
ncbi:pleckstrin homology domain-containing family G member 7 isoform X3 [Patella vulgata]|uniref:pleckstrin homology domain-containing family G member 7 isoform X3 n=1 Tax=Patella vulgata TaxID=6465 RepID=UPI00218069E1|nr:pleckstrin homology domain-containing family G member 7 isoform X3 [Patella vulgata]